tara:strand:- start:2068 stop:2232 length:165 start_codon:yes stop_codon:yes gene_type:complete
MWKKTSEIKTVTRDELFNALHNNRQSLPDWAEVGGDEGYVTINFYVDERDEDDE